MVKTIYENIVKNEGYCGGMACVKGTRVTVAGLVIMKDGGDSIEDIVSAYPNLNEGLVSEAFGYAFSNSVEVSADIYILTRPPRGFNLKKNRVLERDYT